MTGCFPMRGAALSAAAAQRKDNILPVIKKIQAAGVTTLMGIASRRPVAASGAPSRCPHARRLIGLHGLLIAFQNPASAGFFVAPR
jgi:hypothetical protein